MAQDLSSIVVAVKKQSAIDVRATGAGATGLELLPSQGFAPQIASIATELLSRSRMAGKGRQGSEFFNWSGEMELAAGGHEVPIAAVIGGTMSTALVKTQATQTSCAITGTGTTITFTGGDLIADGVRVGMTAQLTGMTNAANNGKYFPILGINAAGRVLTVPSGILVDESADTSFTITFSPAVYTPTTYLDTYFTVQHLLPSLTGGARILCGTNFKFNGMSVTMGADAMVKVNYALGGTDLDLLATGSPDAFTSPTFAAGESLTMLDGAVYFNGTKRVDLASFSFGLQAPVSGLPLLTRKKSLDAFLGQFALDGQFTGVVNDGADFDAFRAEDQVSIYLHCAERNAANPWSARYVGIYIPNMSFGGWSVPAGGQGAAIQTVPMNGGRDRRSLSLGFAQTSVLISTSG